MRIVIIGGGIAGLATALYCEKYGFNYTVYERFSAYNNKGHAFLMHQDGVSILNELFKGDVELPGNFVSRFHLLEPSGKLQSNTSIGLWQCVKRSDLIALLKGKIPTNKIVFGKEFSHFEETNNKVTAAVFSDGTREEGAVFVGADGANSLVRNAIMGPTNFTTTETKEVLGIAKSAPLAKKYKGTFTKYQSKTEGLAFGFIPFSETELIWFMQYDCRLTDVEFEESQLAVKDFTINKLKDFPTTVNKLLACTDFNHSYVWHTKDFDPLPSYHKNNVVLMGDAAHLALPFTSAGTTNALRDAKELIDSIMVNIQYESAFKEFQSKRSQSVNAHLFMGRELKEAFLNPSNKPAQIPLIDSNEVEENSTLKVIHYTDPLCSTCWAIEPHLQKFKLLYGNYYESEYVMGGLLKSWPQEKGSIKYPTDVIPYWEKTALKSGMPLNTKIWETNPIESSYPACIAFKAAQMHSLKKAKKYLRRLRELLFIDGERIDNQLVIDLCLQYAGISIDDYELGYTQAEELFNNDLVRCSVNNVHSFPTIDFYINNQFAYRFEGEITFSKLENTFLKLMPNVKRVPLYISVDELLKKHTSFTLKEFSVFTGLLNEDAMLTLNALVIKRRLIEHRVNNVPIWYVI